MSTFTGTLNVNGYNVTLVSFISNSSGVRTLTMGAWIWTLTGNGAIIWNCASASNFTVNPWNPVVCNYSWSVWTRSIYGTTSVGMNNPDFNVTGGSDIVDPNNVGNINYTGFSGSMPQSNRTFWKGAIFSAGMTIGGGVSSITFACTSGVHVFNSNGIFIDCPMSKSGAWTIELGSNLLLGSARTLQIFWGSFSVSSSNYTLSVGLLLLSTATLTLGSATHFITGVWTVFSWGGTITASTWVLKITDSSNVNITFTGSGKIYNNIWFDRWASNWDIIISSSNTFNDFKDTWTAAHSIKFTSGTTQTVSTFTVSGSAWSLISIDSTTTGTHTLTKSGGGTITGNYLNIQHSVATPASTWYATNSTNNQSVATAGSWWAFRSATSATNFLFLF